MIVGEDDEIFMTRSLDVTPKTTEQRILTVAYVTNSKRLRFVLLKLTTDICEASRGLFATTELLVH